ATGRECAALSYVADFAFQVGHVALVQRDLLLVGLEPVQYPLIVELASEPHALLLRQFLLGLSQQLFLVRQLLLQEAAAIAVPLFLRVLIDFREVRWGGLGRGLARLRLRLGGGHGVGRAKIHGFAALGLRLLGIA